MSLILRLSLAALLLAPMGLSAGVARAEDSTVIQVTLSNHRFDPAEIHVPAGKKVDLVVTNKDAEPEEFDSSDLKVEKVIAGGQQATIHLRPLAAGKYAFEGEYHDDTAKGVVIAE
ncbi:MAG TPA: cupredoxin domain-containing protein [Candidatus Cybelea sp.]|nr:cupredoxin domain-containing protein [Candidatus Cybelea sp.]